MESDKNIFPFLWTSCIDIHSFSEIVLDQPRWQWWCASIDLTTPLEPPELCTPPHHTATIVVAATSSAMSSPLHQHDLPGSTTTHTSPNTSSAGGVGQILGSWVTATGQVMQQWTVKKYTLPDKTVASQVLMYRQLLHTACRPTLKLSRSYTGTPAQLLVKNMPWWQTEQINGQTVGMEETGKMILSYDNLIKRLWYMGAMHHTVVNQNDDPPPIPHEYWVSRLGFQQPDPVTDFRSGGILSLAMMVWIVESCPTIYQRFHRSIDENSSDGDASVLPFGITSINVTDMMAKFLMLSKSTDRMDALLSQKPFWQMFSDPYALLTCQELALDMLADVVQEVRAVRQVVEGSSGKVTVFDFSHILAVTERRVEFDLLGAGPTTVKELRMVHRKLQLKYKQQLNKEVERLLRQQAESNDSINSLGPLSPQEKIKHSLVRQASGIGAAATGLGVAASGLAGNVIKKISSRRSGGSDNLSSLAGVSASPTSGCDDTMNFAKSPVVSQIDSQNNGAVSPATDIFKSKYNDNDWVGVERVTQQVSECEVGNDDDDLL